MKVKLIDVVRDNDRITLNDLPARVIKLPEPIIPSINNVNSKTIYLLSCPTSTHQFDEDFEVDYEPGEPIQIRLNENKPVECELRVFRHH